MSVIGWYCKGYEQHRFNSYPGWATAKAKYDATHGVLAESEILFVHEDLAVTAGAVREEGIVLEDTSTTWRDFCTGELQFRVPEYMSDGYSPSLSVATPE